MWKIHEDSARALISCSSLPYILQGGWHVLRLGQQLNATLQLIPKQHYDDILEVLQLGAKLFGVSG
jgi:hypothetical protein